MIDQLLEDFLNIYKSFNLKLFEAPKIKPFLLLDSRLFIVAYNIEPLYAIAILFLLFFYIDAGIVQE